MTITAAVAPPREHPRLRFLTRRLGRLLVALGIVLTASFSLIHLIPGDPVRAALGVSAPPRLVALRRAELGLDDPLLAQFWHYLSGVVTGDLGTSIVSRLPVAEVVGQRLGSTLVLAVSAFVVVVVVALPLGMVTAIATAGGQRRLVELGFTAATGLLVAIPEFLLAIGLIVVFGVGLAVLPVAGAGGIDHLVLPVLALAVGPTAYLARIVRVEALGVLGQDYMRTARAKRLPGRILHLRHGLPNMLTSALTASGMMLTGLVAGTVLVETVFAWPGLGGVMVSSIVGKDYPTVQGIVLVYAVMVLAVNLVVDLLLAAVDPRSTIAEG